MLVVTLLKLHQVILQSNVEGTALVPAFDAGKGARNSGSFS